jgi:alpha-mannosidase
MPNFLKNLLLVVIASLTLGAHAQTSNAPDLTVQPTLYVVPYAHLDTQWRWEFPQVISEYLLKTLRVNFYYMDKYPHYVFNWTGSNRYRLMKEYYPADYERMKQYVARGQWFPAGSSVEEGDVNLPILTSGRISALPALSICCRTVSGFRLLCRRFWRIRALRAFRRRS